jgi:hypothetical protein
MEGASHIPRDDTVDAFPGQARDDIMLYSDGPKTRLSLGCGLSLIGGSIIAGTFFACVPAGDRRSCWHHARHSFPGKLCAGLHSTRFVPPASAVLIRRGTCGLDRCRASSSPRGFERVNQAVLTTPRSWKVTLEVSSSNFLALWRGDPARLVSARRLHDLSEGDDARHRLDCRTHL